MCSSLSVAVYSSGGDKREDNWTRGDLTRLIDLTFTSVTVSQGL